MGIANEAGEVISPIKAAIFYGRELDEENLKEELGDLLFFINLMAYELNVSFEELLDMNARKLFTRYPEGFSEEAANLRNIRSEQDAMAERTD